jgi:hypothetical protein
MMHAEKYVEWDNEKKNSVIFDWPRGIYCHVYIFLLFFVEGNMLWWL